MRGRDVVWIYRRLEMKKWLSCNNRQSNSMQNTESNKGNVNYNRHNQLKLKSKCNGYFDKMSAQERKRRCQIPTIGVISCTERRGRHVHRAPVQGWMDQADATPVLVTASNTTRGIGQSLPGMYKILFKNYARPRLSVFDSILLLNAQKNKKISQEKHQKHKQTF